MPNTRIYDRPLAALLAPLEDPVGLARPLWRDYARYQYPISPAQAVINGVCGAAFRAGISYGYTDPFFATYWAQWEGYDMYRTSYHVLYPQSDVIRQADNWYRIHPELDLIPRVIDLELSGGMSWGHIGEQTWRMSEKVLERDGVRPIIYTRYLLVRDWLYKWTPEMINAHYWWLAQYGLNGYIEHPGPPTRDPRMKESQVILHQTSDRKRSHSGEVGSGAVDWDRWEIGNEAQMHDWIANTWGEGTQPPPPPPPDFPKHVTLTNNLNVRDVPSGTDIGTLKAGSDVTVIEQQGDWLKLAEGWIHGDYVQEI